MKPTNGRKPRTGEAKLRVKFRNGRVGEFTASQIRWTQNDPKFGEGWDWDVIEVELVGAAIRNDGRQANGSYE